MASEYYLNASAATWTCAPAAESNVANFHSRLPDYNETPLHELSDLARDLGVSRVYLKDESHRFGLPAFKILGASWAVYRAVCEQTGLSPNVSLEELGKAANEKGIRLVTCTEGNWGRAVARMAKYLSIKARIFVPKFMVPATQKKIEGEGAEVIVVKGDYDFSVQSAIDDSKSGGSLLVMDVAWDGYEKIPAWVVEGYSTMLTETDRQLKEAVGKAATHAFVPIGVGSVGHAVTEHYKSHQPVATVIAVEPDTAACLKASLEAGEIVSVETGESIMCGMNCGTVSKTAWPILSQGADVSITLTDKESHEAVKYLKDRQISAGPCGGATVAALRKMSSLGVGDLGKDSIIILFSTEGAREYEVPS